MIVSLSCVNNNLCGNNNVIGRTEWYSCCILLINIVEVLCYVVTVVASPCGRWVLLVNCYSEAEIKMNEFWIFA